MYKIGIILLLMIYCLAQTHAQTVYTTYRDYSTRKTTPSYRPGAYVPRKSKNNDGRYIPDDRGKYKHVSIPPVPYEHISIPALPPGNYSYQGGYQNKYFPTPPTTQKYTKAATTQKPTKAATTQKPPPKGGALNLGPNDHLRFMIDFNFNDGGWQIVQFDWHRDDEGGPLRPKYSYVNERKIFNVPPPKTQSHMAGYFYSAGDTDRVHLDGRLDNDIVSYNFTETNPTIRLADNANIKETIGEVLEFVKKAILPDLS